MSISVDLDGQMDAGNAMEARLSAVEVILNHKFRNRKLLEDALTHSSDTTSPSYQRLEFVGDAALGLAFAQFLYLEYPMAAEGLLTDLRKVNVRNVNLARVALHHDLFSYVRQDEAALELQVQEFARAVQEENETTLYGDRKMFLADIVESVVGAVYMDCDFDLKVLWPVIRRLLEPIITLQALVTLDNSVVKHGVSCKVNEMNEIEAAKQKLQELCDKKKWPEPIYGIEETKGPAHARKYVCSVKIETEGVKLYIVGDAKPRVKAAENSAASCLIHSFVLSMCKATSICPPGIFIILSGPLICLI